MKKILEILLEKRLFILLLAVIVMGAGIYSYKKLPVDAFPDVSPNLVQVFTETQGLAPEEIEKYITFPIETAMTGLPGIEEIRSVSNFGLSVVNIYFKEGMDIYFCRQLVGEKLQEAKESIPEGFGEPKMGPISTGMGLVLFYYLKDNTGKYSLTDLRTIQDWIIKYQLLTVKGVTEVLGIGGFEKQYQVIINPQALLTYNITLQDIIEKIKENNLNVGGSFIEKNGEEAVIRSIGLVQNIKDMENIVIKTFDGRPVYLKNIAKIKIGGAIRRGIQTRNGVQEVVAGMVVKLYGTNSSEVIKNVEEKIKEINKSLPKGIEIVPYYQQKDIVEASVSTVRDALLQGILLVILILFIFMGEFRPSIVVAGSIPFSILFTFIGMKLLGMSANLMSLGGLAIAIGMLVDGTIVVVENIDRHLKSGEGKKSIFEVVKTASAEIYKPIIFAISIIIIVFLPLFTLQGVEGKTFRPLAYTVALAMLGSLIYTLFLAPTISSFLLKNKVGTGKSKGEILLEKMSNSYKPLVEKFVNHRKLALVIAGILLLSGIIIFPQLGSEFTPELKEGTIIVRLTMPPSISLNQSKKYAMIVEKRLLKIPEVKEVITRIGRGEVGAHTDPINSAEIYVILKSKNQWRKKGDQEYIEKTIRSELGEIPGILVNLTQPIEMTVDELLEGVRAELALKLFGEDLNTLKEKADKIAEVLQTVKGATDVQVDQVSGTPQIVIVPDRKKIARYGININDIQVLIKAAVGGEVVGKIFEGTKRFDIFVRFAKHERDSVNKIKNLIVTSSNGIKIPLSELATVKEIIGPRQITRENGQRFITIQCNVVDRDIGSFVEEASSIIGEKVKLPPGYFLTWGGQFKLQQQANKRLAIVIPITLLLVTLLLYSSFGSMKNATLILLNIPLALVGGIWALYLTGQNLSVPASVGFIALFGIALENAMVLVSYLNQLTEEGIEVDAASVKGATLRLRPVLMTALTTALGLIPLLLSTGTGSEVQKPLAIVVIGGLITSTVLTLLIIPSFYKWFRK
ncbi:cobalt-zinc-cadmium resistance protein CzcA [Thermotomaculum hydrothermale]|uniref:Cobalt-zinc-cadmium resistance protein CzcA n=1 Tax=Thermotomaculum hydrothermale TaxID=981385 RepID=A0A7R6PSE3_9BACT|nr:CusA/CzcA family heavy metal efflux RND transporter [Thermotomaculum hydrothermale]BBB31737.1 cobalt-zinc-cadmium resistance protein CzcA [Thermotomaculum hydrothermale]